MSGVTTKSDKKAVMSANLKRVRIGKTARERESGVHENRFANRDLRVSWQHEASGKAKVAFPATACNGKKNRHRWTGKGGKTVLAGTK